MRERPEAFRIDPEAWRALHPDEPYPVRRRAEDGGLTLVSMTVLAKTRTATREVLVIEIRRTIYGMLSPRGQGELRIVAEGGVTLGGALACYTDVDFATIAVDSEGRLRAPGLVPVTVTDEGLEGTVRTLDVLSDERPRRQDGERSASAEDGRLPSDPVAWDLVDRLPGYGRMGGPRPPATGLRFLGWTGGLGAVRCGRDLAVIDPDGILVATVEEVDGLPARLDEAGRLVVGDRVPMPVSRDGLKVRENLLAFETGLYADRGGRWTPDE